jgi:hypothetical protein
MEFLLLYMFSERGMNNRCMKFFLLRNRGMNPEAVDKCFKTILMVMKITVNHISRSFALHFTFLVTLPNAESLVTALDKSVISSPRIVLLLFLMYNEYFIQE